MSIFKPCDIRGVYPNELDENITHDIGHAIGSELQGATCVLAGDVRPSTAALMESMRDGLMKAGVDVLDLGAVPTPVAYWARRRLAARGVVIVTASHNPPEYNGVKFALGDLPVTPGDVQRIKDRIATGDYETGAGSCRREDLRNDYLDWLADRFAGTGAGRRVVVDAGNGAASLWAPEAFARAGYDVCALYCEPDGTFPNRSPNPSRPEAVSAAEELVRAESATFGACFDGDGDRAVLIDDRGRFVPAEETLLLLARATLARERGAAVVYDRKCPSLVEEAIRAQGGRPLPERSGHAFIKRRLLLEDAALGGEASGHFFFREVGGDDGLFAALMVGELTLRAGKTLGELIEGIPPYFVSPDVRIPCPVSHAPAVMEHLARAFADHRLDRMDGVRVEFENGWALCRPSVTEPAVTLRVEGRTQEDMEAILDRMRGEVEAAIGGH